MDIDVQRNRLTKSECKNIYDMSYVFPYGVYVLHKCLSDESIYKLHKIFEDDKELSPNDENALEIVSECLRRLSLTIEIISVHFSNHKSKSMMTSIGVDSNNENIYNMVIPLQEVKEDMGPFIFFPNTNNIITYKQFIEEQNKSYGEVIERPHVKGLIKKGDSIIYQSNILKCMSDNTSDVDNKMLVITYREQKQP